jgi:uncharacterized membrane protein YjjP (DUF1212 family)
LLDKIDSRQGSYPFWVQMLAFALMGFSTCIIFYGGKFVEAGIAAAFSFVYGFGVPCMKSFPQQASLCTQ